MFIVRVTYANGSVSEHPCKTFIEANEMCRTGISYSGGRVRRVEIDDNGSVRAMWDAAWDRLSQRAGLARAGCAR